MNDNSEMFKILTTLPFTIITVAKCVHIVGKLFEEVCEICGKPSSERTPLVED